MKRRVASILHKPLNVAGLAAMFAIFAVFLASCGGGEAAGAGESGGGESAGGAEGVSVATLIDNPSEFYGNQVTVSGLVTEVIGPNAFVIGGNEFVGGEGLMIVGAQELSQIVEGLPEGEEIQAQDLVQVTGTVRPAEQQEITSEIGYELDDQVFEAFGGEAAVVASQVVVTPQQGGTSAQAQQQGAQVALSTIVDNPSEFYGRTVTVSGPVARVLNPNAFVTVAQEAAQQQNDGFFDDPETLAEQGVLVVSGSGSGPNLTENQSVQVTGQVQRFDVTTFEQELGVQFEENNEDFLTTFSENDGPAIVANSIQPQAGGTTQQTTNQ